MKCPKCNTAARVYSTNHYKYYTARHKRCKNKKCCFEFVTKEVISSSNPLLTKIELKKITDRALNSSKLLNADIRKIKEILNGK